MPTTDATDGHALRFYTMAHHTDPQAGEVTTIHDPRETAERREKAERAVQAAEAAPTPT